jgi:hypothetical protein
MVYLAQKNSAELQAMAQEHAAYLGLEYHYHYCGDIPLKQTLAEKLT